MSPSSPYKERARLSRRALGSEASSRLLVGGYGACRPWLTRASSLHTPATNRVMFSACGRREAASSLPGGRTTSAPRPPAAAVPRCRTGGAAPAAVSTGNSLILVKGLVLTSYRLIYTIIRGMTLAAERPVANDHGMVTRCPVCGHILTVRALWCNACDSELRGRLSRHANGPCAIACGHAGR